MAFAKLEFTKGQVNRAGNILISKGHLMLKNSYGQTKFLPTGAHVICIPSTHFKLCYG